MITDFHTHIFNDEIKRDRRKYFKDPIFKYLYNSEKAKIINAEDIILEMENNNIDSSIVMGFGWEDIKYCEQHNQYLLESSQKYSKKIIPFAGMPAKNNYNIENYIVKIKEAGFKGIGELSFYLTGLTDGIINYLEIIFQTAAKYDLPVCLHLNEPIGHDYPGKYAPAFTKIYNLIKSCPDTKIILAHWGGGIFFYELMAEVMEIFQNVFYDTAASPFLFDVKIFKIALEIIGPKKILFGSDYPLIKPDRYFLKLSTLFHPSIIDSIFNKNLANL